VDFDVCLIDVITVKEKIALFVLLIIDSLVLVRRRPCHWYAQATVKQNGQNTSKDVREPGEDLEEEPEMQEVFYVEDLVLLNTIVFVVLDHRLEDHACLSKNGKEHDREEDCLPGAPDIFDQCQDRNC